VSNPPSAEETLYELGWRQGSIFRATLSHRSFGLGVEDEVRPIDLDHELWVVASQDCDLNALTLSDKRPLIELRPGHEGEQPQDWGIRSRRVRLTDEVHVNADDPHVHLSANVLASYASDISVVHPERALAFKTWLGLRYDRPAVPTKAVPLAVAIAEQARRHRDTSLTSEVHDLLVQFDLDLAPPRYVLVAIVAKGADRDGVRTWLAKVAASVPAELGVAQQLQVASKSEASIELLENSYAADVTQITWRSSGPTGAI
jgi:hypothetical protein